MTERFIRDRITQLRMQKGVSEYQMSYDLGHSRGYVYNISSGKALPPLREFLSICEYLNISPRDFFDESVQNPEALQRAVDGLRRLDREDLLLVLNMIDRLLKEPT